MGEFEEKIRVGAGKDATELITWQMTKHLIKVQDMYNVLRV